MLQPIEFVVETLITGAQTLREIVYPLAAGTLIRIDIVSDSEAAGGAATFDVLLNGATIFPGGVGRPAIADGDATATAEGLSAEVVRNDKLRFILAAVTGSIGARLYVYLTFEDGLTDVAGYPMLEGGNAESRQFPRLDPVAGTMSLQDEELRLSDVITNLYEGALLRVPSGGELAAGVAALAAVRGNAIDFIAEMRAQASAIFTGAEYLARATTNAVYVDNLYTAILRRNPDAAAAAWVASVVSDGRAAVLLGFVNSEEFYRKRISRAFWQSITGYDAASIHGQQFADVAGAEGDVWTLTGGVWTPAPPDGGGAVAGYSFYDPERPPVVPNARDDEFPGIALDAKWTAYQGGDATSRVVGKSLFQLIIPPANAVYKLTGIYQPLATAGDWTLVARVGLQAAVSNYHEGGLCLFENAASAPNTCKLWTLNFISQAAGGFSVTQESWTNHITFGAQASIITRSTDLFFGWLKVVKVGSAYSCAYSADGRLWKSVGSANPAFVPVEIGYIGYNYAATGSPSDLHLCDSFRFYPGAEPTLFGDISSLI